MIDIWTNQEFRMFLGFLRREKSCKTLTDIGELSCVSLISLPSHEKLNEQIGTIS